jgi:hypothetical protein
MKRFAWLVALLMLGGATLSLHGHLDALEAERTREKGWVPPPSLTTLKVGSLGYEHMTSDFMWLQALQYYGAHEQNKPDGFFRLLVPILKTVVGLDPSFEYAYRFGGVSAVGPKGENVALANELLALGSKARPDSWRIPYLKASNCLQYTPEDNPCIAEGFARASQIEGAPEWMDLLASRALANNREEGLARDLIYRALQRTTDPILKARLQDRLVALEVSEVLHGINSAVEAWRAQGGKGCPQNLSDLSPYGVDSTLEPPAGGQYFLDEECKAQSSTQVGDLELYRR